MRRLFLVLFLLLIVGFVTNIMISDSHKFKDITYLESDKIFIELSDEEIEMRHWIKLRELAKEKLMEVK